MWLYVHVHTVHAYYDKLYMYLHIGLAINIISLLLYMYSAWKYSKHHWNSLKAKDFRERVETLISRNYPVTEKLLARIKYLGDAGSIRVGAHSEDMHLIEVRDLLQELHGKWSQSAVVEHGVTRQPEPIYILHDGREEGT